MLSALVHQVTRNLLEPILISDSKVIDIDSWTFHKDEGRRSDTHIDLFKSKPV